MFIEKGLLLKGAASLGVVGAAVGGYVERERIKELFSSSSTEVKNLLLDRAGISCNDQNGCSLGTGKEIFIRQSAENTNDKKVTTLTPTTSTGAKIVLKKIEGGNNYNEGLKFTVTGGDISLGDTPSTKLEELETYELKEEDGGNGAKKYVLVRKTTRGQEIKSGLDLPGENCDLPAQSSTPKDCSLNLEKLKKIKFKDKASGEQNITISGSTLTLKIHKTTDGSFPFGYKFVFESESEISITSTTEGSPIKLQKNIDFRIKKESDGSLSLEKAWDIGKLLEKVGLSGCESAGADGADCSIKENKLNVSHGSDKKVNDKNKNTTGTNGGKIKLYLDSANNKDYKENMKFVIEEGDISIGSSGEAITKLEQFETYEIKEDGGKHYLTRKKKSWEEKRRLLGLPEEDGCAFPEGNDSATKECKLTDDKLKKINFDGKSGDITVGSGDGETTLKISVTQETDATQFPLGYKFELQSNKEITLDSSSNKKIKKGTNTEFKIKKSGSGKSTVLSLEKAWTVTSLADKVGLTCTSSPNKECTLNDKKINVKNGSDGTKKFSGLSRKEESENSKKVKYEEDVENHNQGFRFYAEQEISLKNGEGDNGNDKKIEAKGDSNSVYYEIKKDNGT